MAVAWHGALDPGLRRQLDGRGPRQALRQYVRGRRAHRAGGRTCSRLPAWQEGAVLSSLDAIKRLHKRVLQA